MRHHYKLACAALVLLAAAVVPARAQGPLPDSSVAVPKVVEHLPDSWKDDEGLVIGQIGGSSEFGVYTARGEDGVGVNLKRQWRQPKGRGLFRGVLLFTRGEGETVLANISGSAGEIKSSSMGDAEITRTLPLNRSFATRKGQITVLGLMYLRKIPGEDKFQLFAFDNRDESIDYLRRTYPQLLAGHDGAEVVLAPGKYLPMERLTAFRTALATEAARGAKRQGQFWIASRVGTIAEVKVAGDSVQVLRFLPPVTYQEPLRSEWDAQGVLTFWSMTHRWRVVNGVVEELSPLVEGRR